MFLWRNKQIYPLIFTKYPPYPTEQWSEILSCTWCSELVFYGKFLHVRLPDPTSPTFLGRVKQRQSVGNTGRSWQVNALLLSHLDLGRSFGGRDGVEIARFRDSLSPLFIPTLLQGVQPETRPQYTVNFLNIRTPKKFVVITLKFELCGFTIE